MKKKIKITWLLACVLLIIVGCGSRATIKHSNRQTSGKQVQKTRKDNKKTLIIYYSYSGTTQRVAEQLKQLTKGTLYELKLQKPYTGDSNEVSDRVFAERGKKKMPKLKGKLPDVTKYDQILIGTPVWNASMSNPTASYLEQTDFDGKTVAPFWTYITDEGSTEKDFKKRSQNAQMADGLALDSPDGMSDEELDEALNEWLDGIN